MSFQEAKLAPSRASHFVVRIALCLGIYLPICLLYYWAMAHEGGTAIWERLEALTFLLIFSLAFLLPNSKTPHAPQLFVRAALWLGIYLTGCFLFSIGPGEIYTWKQLFETDPWERLLVLTAFFPIELGGLVPDLISFNAYRWLPIWLSYTPLWGIYLAHFIWAMRAQRSITFFIGLALLVLLIGLTFLGAHMAEMRFEKTMGD